MSLLNIDYSKSHEILKILAKFPEYQKLPHTGIKQSNQ